MLSTFSCWQGLQIKAGQITRNLHSTLLSWWVDGWAERERKQYRAVIGSRVQTFSHRRLLLLSTGCFCLACRKSWLTWCSCPYLPHFERPSNTRSSKGATLNGQLLSWVLFVLGYLGWNCGDGCWLPQLCLPKNRNKSKRSLSSPPCSALGQESAHLVPHKGEIVLD